MYAIEYNYVSYLRSLCLRIVICIHPYYPFVCKYWQNMTKRGGHLSLPIILDTGGSMECRSLSPKVSEDPGDVYTFFRCTEKCFIMKAS